MTGIIQQIQSLIGVTADGVWGPKSQAALDGLVSNATWHHALSSAFAYPSDIEAFKRCKALNKSDLECFEVGDNGIGFWGDDTTGPTLMCALHESWMILKWGNVAAAKHKQVMVNANGKTILCQLADKCGFRSRVDLNPAAVQALGCVADDNFLITASWSWAVPENVDQGKNV